MSLAPQSAYIAQAQQVQALWNQFRTLLGAVGRISDLTNENGAQNVWKAMATAAQKADGSLGAGDTSPVNTDPITVGNLNMTADDIINALNDLVMIKSVFEGTLTAASYTQVDHRGDAPSVTTLSS